MIKQIQKSVEVFNENCDVLSIALMWYEAKSIKLITQS